MKQFLIRNKLTDMYWGDSYFLENYTMFEPRNICYYRREVNE